MVEEIVIPALVALGTIMVLGFIGNYIFNKTNRFCTLIDEIINKEQ